MERDRVRDEYSISCGYKVLRIPAKVVFNTPREAINRVKEALKATPVFTQVRQLAPEFGSLTALATAVTKRSVSENLNALVDGMDAMSSHVERSLQKQKLTAAFISAIDREKLLLEALVSSAEHEQEKEKLPPRTLEIYEELSELLDEPAKISDIFKPEDIRIDRPTPVADTELQRQIDSAYGSAMEDRAARLRTLKERCDKDHAFTRYLSRKMIEANLPERIATEIVPSKVYADAFFEAVMDRRAAQSGVQ